MSSAVVGFDIGSLTSYIATAKAGGIEVIANEYSDRCTPTCISFTNSSRLLGTSADQQSVMNLSNTVTSFTRLLGTNCSDKIVNEERRYSFYKIVPDNEGHTAIEVEINGERRILLPQQLLAMQLHKLTEIAENALSCKVVDVVINVPTYFTDRQRLAVIDASSIAGLNCMRIVNDTTAIGIAYGIYNNDLPSPEEKSRIVAFVSLGNSCLQVSITAFNMGRMKVLATSCDPYLGGRNFDMTIFDHMVKEISQKYKINVLKSGKACVRLIKSCEKLKKVMSTNSTEIPLNVECLMEDCDVSAKMKKEFFEELSRPLINSIKSVLQSALSSARLKPKDINFVELAGGGTRIPAVKKVIVDVFGKEGRTTLNADEAVARGCALQAAICSPSYKVREFSILDSYPYSIWINSDLSSISEDGQTLGEEVYPERSGFPSSKQLTYYRKRNFCLKACYLASQGLHTNDLQLGSYSIVNVVPLASESSCEVRIKVRIDANGLFSVRKALIVDKVEKDVEVPIEQPTPQDSKPAEGEKMNEGDSLSAYSDPSTSEPLQFEPMSVDIPVEQREVVEKPKSEQKTRIVTKIVTRPRDVPIETLNSQLSPNKLAEYTEYEAFLVQQEKIKEEQNHLKNAVEEYVYDLRSRLESDLKQCVTKNELNDFLSQLSHTENWIYGDGATASHSELSKTLDKLRTVGEKFKFRMSESQNRPPVLEDFSNYCMHVKQVLDRYANRDPEYIHLSKEDMRKVDNWWKEKHSYLSAAMNTISKMRKTDDPSITTQQLLKEKQAFEALCNPIICRSKPSPLKPDNSRTSTNKLIDSPSSAQKNTTKKSPAKIKSNGAKESEENMDSN